MVPFMSLLVVDTKLAMLYIRSLTFNMKYDSAKVLLSISAKNDGIWEAWRLQESDRVAVLAIRWKAAQAYREAVLECVANPNPSISHTSALYELELCLAQDWRPVHLSYGNLDTSVYDKASAAQGDLSTELLATECILVWQQLLLEKEKDNALLNKAIKLAKKIIVTPDTSVPHPWMETTKLMAGVLQVRGPVLTKYNFHWNAGKYPRLCRFF